MSLLVGLIALSVGLFLGMIFFNKLNYVKFLRALTNKNYVLVNLISDDKKEIKQKVVLLDSDIFTVDEKTYILKENYIYREGFLEKGNKIKKGQVIWKSGLPNIYLDHENLLPITLSNKKNNEIPSPYEIQGFLTAWLVNQRRKDKQTNKDSKNFLIFIVAGLVILSLILTYFLYGMVDQTQKYVLDVKSKVERVTVVKAEAEPSEVVFDGRRISWNL